MSRKVGYFSESKLAELANQPNTTVMQTTHDHVFEPWPAYKVNHYVDKLVAMTSRRASQEEIAKEKEKDAEFAFFLHNYRTFATKLSDYNFVSDAENVTTVKKLLMLRYQYEQGTMTEEEAKAMSSDIALKSLMKRVPSAKR